MANSLLKWCKTKLLNGYKHVESSDEMPSGNRSDTEFLVRSSEEEFLLTPTPHGYSCTPEIPPESGVSYSVNASPRVSLERRKHPLEWRARQGLDYDLHLSEDVCEKREFAFTLYDFHGQGKVTRDDIASLVQSIYETVGSSMSLPPSGSRTVRVKLSVAPTERKNRKTVNRGQRGSNWTCSTPKESPRTLCNDSFVTPNESPRFYEGWSSNPLMTSGSQNESPRTVDSADSLSPRLDYPYPDPSTPRLGNHGCRVPPALQHEEPLDEGDSPIEEITPRRGRRRKTRKVHYQRQELLQMIQASMEKNNLFYPPPGRNTSCHHPHHHNHHHRRRKRPQQQQQQFHNHQCSGCCCRCCSGGVSDRGTAGPAPQVDPATLKARLIHYDSSVNNNDVTRVDTSLTTTEDGSSGRWCDVSQLKSSESGEPSHHHRSRSQDLNSDSPHVFRHHLLGPPTQQQHPLPPSNTPDRPTSPRMNQHHHSHSHHYHNHHHRSRSCDGDESSKEGRLALPALHSKREFQEDSNPCESKLKDSLEYHKAMNEVVSWMEKSNLKDSGEEPNNNGDTTTTTFPSDGDDLILATKNSEDSSQSACGRSHHVHQHFHHHYHHYPSTPLII